MAQAAARPVGAAASPSKRRRTNGADGFSKVINKTKGMVYCLVSKTLTGMFSVEHYENIGWHKVLKKNGGPELAAGSDSRKDGTMVEYQGLVLMEMSQEDFDDLQRVGEDGEGGQELADLIEERLRDRSADIREIQQQAGVPMTSSEGSRYFTVSEDVSG